MSPFFAVVLVQLLAILIGATLGLSLGALLQGVTSGAVAGACLAGAGALLFQVHRARRLDQWLLHADERAAPEVGGWWGDLAYRISRGYAQRQALARQHQQHLLHFLDAIEASPNGVLLLNAGDQIEWANAMAADHLGIDPQRDRLQAVTNLVRAPEFVAYLQSRTWHEPVLCPVPGRDLVLSILVRPYGDDHKLVLTQDMTERQRTETMRREFVANVSHEIRTPLTVLSGFVQTLASVDLTPAERAQVLDLMQQQADRMQALVTDLLQLAQLEGSPRPAPDQWLALGPLLQRITAEAAHLSRGRHRLTLADPGPFELAGHAGELQSALGNLVQNAVRYTPDGGRIDVQVSTRRDGAMLLAVRDSGIGIAREHLPRLAQRFYRVDGSRSRHTGGTGLGLSIAKHVALRHGGELEIESQIGVGSCFQLVLPAARWRHAAISQVTGTTGAA